MSIKYFNFIELRYQIIILCYLLLSCKELIALYKLIVFDSLKQFKVGNIIT